VNSGGTLQLAGTGGDQIFSGVNVTVASGGIFDANGLSEGLTSLTLNGSGSGSGALINNAGTASTITTTAASGFPLGSDVTLGGSGNLTMAGVISGAHNLIKVGSGTVSNTAVNTFTGTTTINGGTVSISTDSGLGAAPGTATAGSVTLNGGTLQQTSTSNGTTFMNGNRGIALGAGGGTISVPAPGVALLYTTGQITGTGNLTKTGAGTFRNTTPSSITFPKLIVNGGLYQAAADSIFGAVPGSFTADAITLNGGGISVNAGFIFNVNRGITLGAGGGSIDGASSAVISAIITGSGALTKTGTGTFTLTGANTYTGATTVSGGTLLVNSPGSLAAGSAVTVASGASLSGSGTINGSITVNSGGALAATNGTSVPTINGATVIAAGGTLTTVDSAITTITFGSSLSLAGTTKMEISKTAANADKIVMSSGTVTLGGNLNVVNLGGTLVLGDTFTLISGTKAGSFGSFTLPALATGLKWDTSQLSAGGNGTIKVVCDGTLAASAGANKTTCPGVGVAIGGSPTATGGSGSYTYSWSPGTGLSSATAANPTASPTSTTTYTVTVSDSAGCSAPTSSMTVTVVGAPAITSQPGNATICSGKTTTLSVAASGSGLSYSWANNNNAGWGSAWTASGSGALFLQTSTQNDQSNPDCTSFTSAGDINSPISGMALGMWGGNSGDEVATRTFTALTAGKVVSIDFDNGNVDNGSKVGFSLQTSGGADLLQFYFVGGQSNYKYWDTTLGEQDSGIAWGYTGKRVQFILTSATTYALIVTPCGGTATTLTGTFSGSIAQLKLFNGNTAGGDADNIYFNNLLVGGYSDNADNYSGGWAGQDKGNQAIVAGNGGSTYTTPALTATAQYQVTVYNCGGAVLSTVATVTVNPLPSVSVNSGTICAGDSTNLTATTSASSPAYLWSPGGATTATITVSPASTTIYTCLVTDGTTGCTNSASGTVTVNPLPTVSVNSATICVGGSVMLTATTSANSPSYLWSTGGATTSSITVSPASTTVYTCMVTDGTTGCANSGSGTVTVNPLPSVSVNSDTICAGGSAMLTATTSASNPSYLWSPGGSTNASITVSPGSTTTYTCTVTDGTTGCSNSGSGTVTVNPLPSVSVNSETICAGSSAMLTATTSASSPTYLWSPGGATNASITVSPASTTTYTCTVTDGTTGCANSGSGTVTVNPLPTLITDTTNQTACAGSEVTWSVEASGAGLTYQWQRDGTNLLETVSNFTGTTNATLTNSAVAAPDDVSVAHGYACVISAGSCSITSSVVSLTVNPLPSVSVNSATICAGGLAMLSATTSASNPSYLWSPGGATNASITVSPGSTTTYTCTVTDGTTGCANSGSGTVTVNPLPSVSVNSVAICPGGSAMLTATTSASDPSYLWSPGGATSVSITVSPPSTTMYTCTVTDGTTGCANSGSGTVTVNAAPTVSAGPNESACSGVGVSIGGSPTASGGLAPYTYSWTPITGLSDATVANPTATVTSTTTYTVLVTDANGCTNGSSMTVTVIPQPFISPTPTVSFPDVTLTWNSLAGTTYRVQYTTAFNPATWIDLTPDVTASGSTATYTDTGAADLARFYRVRVICP
jgi:autotransporter-associated beta strand protein